MDGGGRERGQGEREELLNCLITENHQRSVAIQTSEQKGGDGGREKGVRKESVHRYENRTPIITVEVTKTNRDLSTAVTARLDSQICKYCSLTCNII